MGAENELAMAVLHEIAKDEDTDVLDLNKPLQSSINCDALNRLFDRGRGHVTFEYLSYTVTVHSDGYVDLEKPRN